MGDIQTNTLAFGFCNASPKCFIDCGIDQMPEARQRKMVCNVLYFIIMSTKNNWVPKKI